MTKYQKLFGAGPRGLFLSGLILLILIWKKETVSIGPILETYSVGLSIFCILTLVTFLIIAWSLKSLPPNFRGERLVQDQAFKFFRHPLYGAFLSFFNFGLAVLLNDYIFMLWAVLLHPLWHWNIMYEEQLMKSKFRDEYSAYAKAVSRFFPFKFFIGVFRR
ncbi:MAG: hypothetical protein HOE90_06615 [Bacteriovoracaceae bacterium]|jgi:protein-S-isoprenylcysteine O-methyltransferase Ste14|nr:hypothetical protein [Bacteriovoracaceae bacterium]